MRLQILMGTAALCAALCACSGQQPDESAGPVEQPPSQSEAGTDPPDDWAEMPMPSARVRIQLCDSDEGDGIQVTSMSRDRLTKVLERCLPRRLPMPARLVYDGTIAPGMAELLRRVERLTVELDPSADKNWPLLLDIDSGGGDVAEAMAAGNVLATRDWYVHVGTRCYSACVLVLAAGTGRQDPSSAQMWKKYEKDRLALHGKPHGHVVLNDETNIGIHRVFPTLSSATTVDQLYEDTERAVILIGDYLAKHGVSRTLAEDMMSVPSNEIRILTIDEVNRYGLGKVNSAKSDLDRLDILRRCSPDYAERRDVYLREIEVCWRMIKDEDSIGPAQACMESVKQRTRIPDSACSDAKVGG